MSCRNHAGSAAIGACAGCAETYCAECMVTVRGTRYCASCKTMAVTGPPPEIGMPCKAATDALKMAALSFFCFGIVVGPLAAVKASRARQMIAADPRLTGLGRANAALVLGIIATGLWLLNMLSRLNAVGR